MQKYNCPSCSAEISFQSSISASCVCPYCSSLVVRHDSNLESLGSMAQLPDDISPFQLDTAGIYNGLSFRIIGRLKMSWRDGCWNEWFLYFDDAKKAWLAEAQGSLAMIFEEYLTPEQAKAQFSKIPDLNEQVRIAGTTYTVSDRKNTECVGSEGELPFVGFKGRKFKSVDLIAGNKFAGIEYTQDELPSVFTGKYVEFDELCFSNLRELEGWNMPSRKSKVRTA